MSVIERWREWRESRAEHRAAVEEMQFHIARETEYNLGRGMSPKEARRAAMKAFGGVDRFAEEARDERTGTRLSDFAMSYLDWKLGARMLLKYPGLSVIGGLTLAAAIGIGAGWFQMTMVMFYPKLPLDDGDRIVRVESWDAAESALERRLLHDFMAWREQLRSIEQLGAYRTLERNLITGDGESQPVEVADISTNAFALTRVPPLLGRPLTDADAQPGGDDVLVIGYDIWQRRFGGDRDIIGREVRLGRVSARIVGVMPEGFGFPLNHQLWVPLRVTHAAALEGPPIEIFGRLAPGATLESAGAELAAAGARMAAANPATHGQLRPRVQKFAETSGPGARREALLINVAAWLVLAAACANVAALMFARTAMRESEIVVRNALGASRARVMGQLFTESLVLTSAAALVGLAAADFVMRYVFRMLAQRDVRMPFWYDAGIEPVTVLYTGVLAVIGAALIGLLPAIRATGKHVRVALTRMSAGGTSMRFGGVWAGIIVFQVAFSVIFLPFGISAAREALRDYQLHAAFPSDAFLTFRPELDREAAPGAMEDLSDEEFRARMADVMAELSHRLENEPGVTGVTVAGALPGTYHGLRRVEAQREGEAPFVIDAHTEGSRVRIGSVGLNFFETFRVPLVAGRVFSAADVGAQSGVVVINESMARNIGGNAVGVRVRFAAGADGQPGPWNEVIGVVGNLGLTPTARGEADFMYLPVSAADARFAVIHVNGDAAAFAPQLRTVAMEVEPALRIYDPLPLREVIRRHDLPTIHATLSGIGVVLLAIILSAASLYALMSVAVAQRTREIGIRLAVGADTRAVLSSLFSRAARQVGVGILIGNVLVVLLLAVVVEEVQPGVVIPPMIIASAVMALVGLGACLVPGWRALRVQPTEALKDAR